ncbi:hypothetical protein ILUMI_07932 [Ignelater luminosus]|uniref:DDE Tnp4 domain-containing protein n=1 Tax=Ignelater luminosus TaxID=2038154 RepID=A0A8K0GHI9_IGNLU|nr:hypothetical protein ILUMI_07932 [Ignelater luminosus]
MVKAMPREYLSMRNDCSAVADSNCRFIYVDVGSYSKDSDSTIFKNSKLYQLIASGLLNIPEAQPLPNREGLDIPFVFVGDEAFGLSEHVLRSGKKLTNDKRIFNYV